MLIVAEHASAEFGGEAALALHYFRVFRQRGIGVWLLTHARRRDELSALFGGEPRIHYIEDTALQRLMARLGRPLPERLAFFTLGFVSRLSTQLRQRRIIRRLVATERIDVVHQPMPVSPREPSMLFGFGVPVLIGPMNGGMAYPPGFHGVSAGGERLRSTLEAVLSNLLNRLMPGKRQAALLLVANERTRLALPSGLSPRVQTLVENGVDLTLWRPSARTPVLQTAITSFAFMGRLVDWKAVDLLLRAFKQASGSAPIRLLVMGDGVERPKLEALAKELGIWSPGEAGPGQVRFAGWLSQAACAESLLDSDCLVLPSVRECGGAVVLEAMSMAKPVIATAWGGPLDYLDAQCGVLVEPKDPQALVDGFARAMLRLAQAPAERISMGEAGRAKVLRDYDWEAKGDLMLGFYRAAMSGFAALPHGR